jgi:hypothetical protein
MTAIVKTFPFAPEEEAFSSPPHPARAKTRATIKLGTIKRGEFENMVRV